MKRFKYKPLLTNKRLMDNCFSRPKNAVKISLFLMILLVLSFSVSGIVIDADTYTRADSSTLGQTEVLGQSYTEGFGFSGYISNGSVVGEWAYRKVIKK